MGKCIDLSNKKFEKLLVIEKTDKRKGTSIIWKCLCDCGKETFASSSELNSGHKRSCGCLHTKQISMIGENKGYNLIGQKFNKLTVINKTELRKDGRIVWSCICDCGNTTLATSSDLKQNRKKHCEKCLSNNSLGEEKIIQLLQDNNIIFEREKTFENLINNGKKLRFDFFINNQYLIEFDGKQHFIKDSGFGRELENIQLRDNIKNQYCIENKIPLIRIPYYYLSKLKIEDLLLESSDFILKEDI